MEYINELRDKLKFLEEIVDKDTVSSIYSSIEDIEIEFDNMEEDIEEIRHELEVHARALSDACNDIDKFNKLNTLMPTIGLYLTQASKELKEENNGRK